MDWVFAKALASVEKYQFCTLKYIRLSQNLKLQKLLQSSKFYSYRPACLYLILNETYFFESFPIFRILFGEIAFFLFISRLLDIANLLDFCSYYVLLELFLFWVKTKSDQFQDLSIHLINFWNSPWVFSIFPNYY